MVTVLSMLARIALVAPTSKHMMSASVGISTAAVCNCSVHSTGLCVAGTRARTQAEVPVSMLSHWLGLNMAS